MEKFEFCSVDLTKNVKNLYSIEGLVSTEFKRNKDSGLSKKEVAAIEVAKLGLEGWELVNVNSENSFIMFFKRKIV